MYQVSEGVSARNAYIVGEASFKFLGTMSESVACIRSESKG